MSQHGVLDERGFAGEVGAAFGAFGEEFEDEVALHIGEAVAATEAATGLWFAEHFCND